MNATSEYYDNNNKIIEIIYNYIDERSVTCKKRAAHHIAGAKEIYDFEWEVEGALNEYCQNFDAYNELKQIYQLWVERGPNKAKQSNEEEKTPKQMNKSMNALNNT